MHWMLIKIDPLVGEKSRLSCMRQGFFFKIHYRPLILSLFVVNPSYLSSLSVCLCVCLCLWLPPYTAVPSWSNTWPAAYLLLEEASLYLWSSPCFRPASLTPAFCPEQRQMRLQTLKNRSVRANWSRIYIIVSSAFEFDIHCHKILQF